MILRIILTKSGQLPLDMRFVARVTVTDNDKATSIVPRDIHMKAIVSRRRKKDRGQDNVRTSRNFRPVFLRLNLTKNGQFPLNVRSLTHVTVTDNDKNTSKDQRNIFTKAIVSSKMKDRGLDHAQSQFTLN